MRKIYTILFACLLMATYTMAQVGSSTGKTYNGNWTDAALTLDGVADEWGIAEAAQSVENVFMAETPNVVSEFQVLWTDTAFWVQVTREDDEWNPHWVTGGNDWEADKTELYWCVRTDTIACMGGASINASGQYQTAPTFTGEAEGTMGDMRINTWPITYYSADTYDEVGGSTNEVVVPYASLMIEDGATVFDANTAFEAGLKIGFDVCSIDNDGTGPANRQRYNWSNEGDVDESWNTFQQIGTLVLAKIGINKVASVAVNAYPNPTSDLVSINTEFNKAVVYNTIGQEVAVIEDVANRTFSVKDLNTGVYFINVYNNDEAVGTAQILKR